MYILYHKPEHDLAVAANIQHKSAMRSIEEDVEDIAVLDLDSSLGKFKDHLTYRSKRYRDQKALIDDYEGSLEEFALG